MLSVELRVRDTLVSPHTALIVLRSLVEAMEAEQVDVISRSMLSEVIDRVQCQLST